jgi:hypothetical protein
VFARMLDITAPFGAVDEHPAGLGPLRPVTEITLLSRASHAVAPSGSCRSHGASLRCLAGVVA